MLKYRGENMILKIKPTFVKKLWGGNYYSKLYKKDLEKIGEVVLFSTYHEFDLIFFDNNGHEHALKSKYPHIYLQLFSLYPLTLKFIDAKDDLSIQVHPDNQYAKKYHQSLGKEEYWLILDALPNATISIGHNITDNFLLKDVIKNNHLHQFMIHYKIQKGDTFYIPSNTVHAIQKNTRILEIAQASVLNFRVDDYQRLDENGQLRTLHIQEAIDVMKIPDSDVITQFPSHLFSFDLINVFKEDSISLKDSIILCVVISGTGMINGTAIHEGECLVIHQENILKCNGNMEIGLLSSNKKNHGNT